MELEIFKKVALSQIPRILGLGDRHSQSKTFGCFDRYYWHYKITDIPNARFQEVSLIFALLYKNKLDERFFKNQKVKGWLEGVINFWVKIQHNDGSFDEVYPFERSFCATSFSTLALAEACLLMRDEMSLEEALPPLERAGKWLSKHDNLDVTNQMAGAALALANIYLLTGDKFFEEASREKVEKILEVKREKDFFPEYGGYDIGYNSLTLSCLAQLVHKVSFSFLETSLFQVLKRLERDIREDGSFDYSQTSRKTQYLYPLGFLLLKSDIVERIAKGLEKNLIINPAWLDDRYTISLTINYFQTYIRSKNE